MSNPPNLRDLQKDLSEPAALLAALESLRDEVVQEGRETCRLWPQVEQRAFRISSMNLANYLALRRRDLRAVQAALMRLGLSSLGRSEGRVVSNLDAVIATLRAVVGRGPVQHPGARAFFRGMRLLENHARVALGPSPEHRRVRIMVTLPTEAATDYGLVRTLVARGMNVARLNAAHDGPEAWAAMSANVRRASAETGKPCKLMLDLGGPKVRIEAIGYDPDKRFKRGEVLLMTRATPGESKEYPYQLSCAEPAILDQVNRDASVWFDDGSLGARVEQIVPEGLVLRVTQVEPKGARLRAEKGINFPDTDLKLAPLTDKDRQDLGFALDPEHRIEILGYSFVQDPADIELLQAELRQRIGERARQIVLCAKIETPRAVRNLPDLIMQAASVQPFAVMIARGDLAVELGFVRMAEMQEEILWLCEAAHVPVIWATQVLENFVKKGLPSRAEMTDAAMSERAECVMLNKGPYIAEAVTVLDDVLVRMQEHQFKKTPQLRALRSWA